MNGTITGRIPRGALELRAYARGAVDVHRQRAEGEGINRTTAKARNFNALYSTDFAAIEQRIMKHYAPSLRERVAHRIAQWWCGVKGHDSLLHFEGRRVMMRCTSCGHDSPGWDVTGRAPRHRFEGDPARHKMERPS